MLRVVSPKPTTPKLKFSKLLGSISRSTQSLLAAASEVSKDLVTQVEIQIPVEPTLVSFLGYACSFTAVLAIGDEDNSTAWDKFANLGTSQGLDLYQRS